MGIDPYDAEAWALETPYNRPDGTTMITTEKDCDVVCMNGGTHRLCTRMCYCRNCGRVVCICEVICVGADLNVRDGNIATFLDIPPQRSKSRMQTCIANSTRSHVDSAPTLPKINGNTMYA